MINSKDFDSYLEDSFMGNGEASRSMPENFILDKSMDSDLAKELIEHLRLNEAKAD